MSEAGHNSSRRMWLDQSPQRSGPMNFADSVNSAARQTSVNVTTGYRYNVRSASPIMSADVHTLKRSRSPTMAPPGVSTTRSHVLEFDSEREIQAKAKRLARFSAELNKPVSDLLDQNRNIFSEAKPSSTIDKKFAIGYSGKETAVLQGTKYDQEERGPSAPIVGFCQDMCPELERDERERKGDLDQYERLDGDRNQTHISLAVKKYNRTAEREAALIRPMPVLRKTMDYLLHLLDQPYDDKFLGMYNFLWDRMRAVRMDLRMQHIFNQDAIIMLEQMIRLHIVAMHELCEYQKGEGFSEGFDAHLNIEQMNKASVELFQMYDDHRKKGLVVMTENEFRGYYALLKLDRHPGYKVEPAELSLDLAKMTPSLRCSKEISFARDVARACRTGNFIAFFRLARKATYLQACLMHAHFSKVRTNALASLHSGLQNSQGIPIAQVVQWLGMEAEDIESLLEYHGFVIKSFEEAYMVKEGPFLNRDTDYTTKCSELVHCNKSRKIIDDVSSNLTVSVTRSSALSDEKNNLGNSLKRSRPSHRTTEFPLVSDTKNTFGYNQLVFATPLPAQRKIAHEEIAFPSVKTQLATDVEMPDFVDVSIQKNDKGFQPSLPEIPNSLFLSYDENIQEKSHQNGILPISSYESQINYPLFTGDELTEPARQAHASLEPVDRAEERVTQIQMETTPKLDMISVGPYQKEIHENKQKEEEALSSVAHEKSEAAKQRFRMILRTWKRRASGKREIREQRQKLASIALNSLPLGPPVCQNEAQSRDGGKLNLDFVLEERNERHWSSWSRLNVANTVASTLKKKNAKAKCLCWKLSVCIHKGDQEKRLNNLMHTWLLSKLIGRKGENDNELVAVSSGLSIWKNVVDGQGNFEPSICFSIVREVSVEDCSGGASYDAMVGSSAAIYVVAESVPLEIQKVQIDMLLTSIQSKSSIPLLILCSGGSFSKYGHVVINRLGLQDVDKSRVSDISVISLDDVVPEEHIIGYFSDRNLQLGLKWLAEKTPPQPSLHLVKTRELVLRYLNPSIEALNDFEPSEIDPNRCIALFNEALDQSAKQIQDAAEMNANFWPCPEIDLLDGQRELPSTDWSSAVKIKPILDAIKGCKLPYLSHDLSFLSHGSHLGKVIPLHKAKLEECLVNYLTQSSKIMSGDLAMKEAHLMLQNGASLELHGLQYYLIPRWVDIFQRIYNWRLIKMKSREFASAYVLDTVASIKSEPLKLDLDSPLVPKSEACAVDGILLKDSRQVLPIHSRVPLDEMVGVSCRFLPEEDDVPVRSLVTRSDVLVVPPHPAAGIGVSEGEDLRFGRLSEAEGAIVSAPTNQGTLINPIAAAAVGFGKLRTLFEKCKIIQDRIDQKLSLYF